MADTWMLAGSYFETCNCEAACPCVFLSPPTEGRCSALVGWHIDKGRHGDAVLDGLNVALFAHSPGHMLKVKWQAALYLDERATAVQQNALTQIFSGQAGGHLARLAEHIGEVLGVKNAAMEFRADGRRRALRISGIADAAIEAISGQGGADITIDKHPLCVAPGYPAVVARSTQVRDRDHDLALEVSNRNGFYSPFAYQGP